VSVRILLGDCREKLRELADESVHCCVAGMTRCSARSGACCATAKSGLKAPRLDDGSLAPHGASFQAQYIGERRFDLNVCGLKQKDLIGIPWMLAFALRADGWFLRQDIIWSKPNPMPESVQDRCTKAHEYVFMLSKSTRYFYDNDAIREPYSEASEASIGRYAYDFQGSTSPGKHKPGNSDERYKQRSDHQPNPNGRNKRSVWEVATQPFSEAHFATYPPALIEPCILAGCPERCCVRCGAPVVRQVERIASEVKSQASQYGHGAGRNDGGRSQLVGGKSLTLGWEATCKCEAGFISGTVIDPFFGAGTTGLVADRLQRNCIGIELNPEYAEIARRRIEGDSSLFAEVQAA
jgi:hypothetical protein